jgi:hypothetical protein
LDGRRNQTELVPVRFVPLSARKVFCQSRRDLFYAWRLNVFWNRTKNFSETGNKIYALLKTSWPWELGKEGRITTNNSPIELRVTEGYDLFSFLMLPFSEVQIWVDGGYRASKLTKDDHKRLAPMIEKIKQQLDSQYYSQLLNRDLKKVEDALRVTK